MRPANCFGTSFTYSKKAHFAFANQLRHCADCLFNWRVRVNPVLIIEIDDIEIEPAQTSFASLLYIIGLAADAAKLRLGWVAQNSELGCDDDLFAMPSQRAADQLFISVRSIHVRGIEKSDAELERARNCGERFFIIAAAIEVRHAHAAETDRRNARSASPKLSLFHKSCAARERHE